MNEPVSKEERLPHVLPLSSMPGFIAYVHENGKQINFETSLGTKLEFFPEEARLLRDWLNKVIPNEPAVVTESTQKHWVQS